MNHQHIQWLDLSSLRIIVGSLRDAEECKRLFTGQTFIKSPER